MTLYFAGLVIIIIGLGAVGWLMFQEKQNTAAEEEDEGKLDNEDRFDDEESATKILNRLGLSQEESKKAGDDLKAEDNEGKSFLKVFSTFNLGGLFKKKELDVQPALPEDLVSLPDNPLNKTPKQHQLQKTSPSHTAAESSVPDIEGKELKEKCERLEKILKEKNEELEKIHPALSNEIKNRKEFNQVKDVLEKELKDTKDKFRQSQNDSNSLNQEIEKHKKRIDQLEEKVIECEKQFLEAENFAKEKDRKIAQLSKSLEILEKSHAAGESGKPQEPKIPETSQVDENPDTEPQPAKDKEAEPEAEREEDEPKEETDHPPQYNTIPDVPAPDDSEDSQGPINIKIIESDDPPDLDLSQSQGWSKPISIESKEETQEESAQDKEAEANEPEQAPENKPLDTETSDQPDNKDSQDDKDDNQKDEDEPSTNLQLPPDILAQNSDNDDKPSEPEKPSEKEHPKQNAPEEDDEQKPDDESKKD